VICRSWQPVGPGRPVQAGLGPGIIIFQTGRATRDVTGLGLKVMTERNQLDVVGSVGYQVSNRTAINSRNISSMHHCRRLTGGLSLPVKSPRWFFYDKRRRPQSPCKAHSRCPDGTNETKRVQIHEISWKCAFFTKNGEFHEICHGREIV